MGCKFSKGGFFSLSRCFIYLLFFYFFYGPQVDPFSFLFACRTEIRHEKVSTSQSRCRRGTPWDTPITSSLIAAMSAEELRFYSQILAEISLKTSDGAATSTVGEASCNTPNYTLIVS